LNGISATREQKTHSHILDEFMKISRGPKDNFSGKNEFFECHKREKGNSKAGPKKGI